MALLLLTLKNYSELRNEWQKELEHKRKANKALELLRSVFKLSELIELKDEFKEKFEELIRSKYPSVLASQVLESIKNNYYNVGTEWNGSANVEFIFPQANQDDIPSSLRIGDNNLFKLMGESEKIIFNLMKAHNKAKEKESGTHALSPRDIQMITKSFEKLISDGASPSAHGQEKDASFNGVSQSLCDQKEKHSSYRPFKSTGQEGDDKESTTYTEEVVETKGSGQMHEEISLKKKKHFFELVGSSSDTTDSSNEKYESGSSKPRLPEPLESNDVQSEQSYSNAVQSQNNFKSRLKASENMIRAKD